MQHTLVILLEDFGRKSLERLRQKQSNFYPISLALKLAIAITEILGRIHAANVIHLVANQKAAAAQIALFRH